MIRTRSKSGSSVSYRFSKGARPLVVSMAKIHGNRRIWIFPSTCAQRESPIRGVLLNPRSLRHQGRGTQGNTPFNKPNVQPRGQRERSEIPPYAGHTPTERVRWEFGAIPAPGNPCHVLVRATVQNRKQAGTKIFFIRVTTSTYGDFGGWRNPFFCADSRNTAGNRGRRID
jgi:hypothetical protein